MANKQKGSEKCSQEGSETGWQVGNQVIAATSIDSDSDVIK